MFFWLITSLMSYSSFYCFIPLDFLDFSVCQFLNIKSTLHIYLDTKKDTRSIQERRKISVTFLFIMIFFHYSPSFSGAWDGNNETTDLLPAAKNSQNHARGLKISWSAHSTQFLSRLVCCHGKRLFSWGTFSFIILKTKCHRGS